MDEFCFQYRNFRRYTKGSGPCTCTPGCGGAAAAAAAECCAPRCALETQRRCSRWCWWRPSGSCTRGTRRRPGRGDRTPMRRARRRQGLPLSSLLTPLSTLIPPHSSLPSRLSPLLSPISSLLSPLSPFPPLLFLSPLSSLLSPLAPLLFPLSSLSALLSSLLAPGTSLRSPLSAPRSPLSSSPLPSCLSPLSSLLSPLPSLLSPLSSLSLSDKATWPSLIIGVPVQTHTHGLLLPGLATHSRVRYTWLSTFIYQRARPHWPHPPPRPAHSYPFIQLKCQPSHLWWTPHPYATPTPPLRHPYATPTPPLRHPCATPVTPPHHPNDTIGVRRGGTLCTGSGDAVQN